MEEKVDRIRIEPTDESIRSYGQVKIEWETALFELVNNSIQAAEDRDLDLELEIGMFFNEDEVLNKISISDKSGGISRQDIKLALTPSGKKQSETTLSEHGLGLNVAQEFFIRDGGTAEIISYLEDDAFMINDKVSYINEILLKPVEEREDHSGLSIIFDNISSLDFCKYPTRATSQGFNTWLDACRKYRYKYKDFIANGKNFNITFKYECGTRSSSRRFSPIAPVLQNPLTGRDEFLTQFTLVDGDLQVQFKLGVANQKKDHYDYELKNGANIWYKRHPYRVGHDCIGFETFYKNVMIEYANLKTVPIADTGSGDNYREVSLMRGEMHILSGGSSVFTKDGLSMDKKLSSIIKQGIGILNGVEPHPQLGKKLNYMKEYVHTLNYSKGEVPKESVLKRRHREMFEANGIEIRQEVFNEHGIADMVVENRLLEHKKSETRADDILQLFKYVIAFKDDPKINTFELWAPSHSDSARKMLEDLKPCMEFYNNATMKLAKMPSMMIRSELTDDERDLLKKPKRRRNGRSTQNENRQN